MLMRTEPAYPREQAAPSGTWSVVTTSLAEQPTGHTDSIEYPAVERWELSVVDTTDRFHRALRGYLAAVAEQLGVGLEACTLDLDVPASAYVALDRRLPGFPDRDLALLWDEVNGWAAAIETHSGEDLIVVSYLDSMATGTATVTPSPRLVARFVRDLRTGHSRPDRLDPPALRAAGEHQNLIEDLESATVRT